MNHDKYVTQWTKEFFHTHDTINTERSPEADVKMKVNEELEAFDTIVE